MIHHIEVEVAGGLMADEIAFWGALGWKRDHQKHRGTDWEGEWLVSRFPGDPRLWLVGYGRAIRDLEVRFCLIRRLHQGDGGVLADLDRLPFKVTAERLELYWGAERIRVWSPSGWGVELLDAAPPAARYGPPVRVVEEG